jgi:hypothetical protein
VEEWLGWWGVGVFSGWGEVGVEGVEVRLMEGMVRVVMWRGLWVVYGLVVEGCD